MATTFTWLPSQGATETNAPRMRSVKFGDGYELRQQDGLNPIQSSYNLSFNNRDPAEIQAIDDFLTACGGINWFYWTPPRGSVALKYICKKWDKTYITSGVDGLTATFEQVFDNG